jgi:hypothetical protein
MEAMTRNFLAPSAKIGDSYGDERVYAGSKIGVRPFIDHKTGYHLPNWIPKVYTYYPVLSLHPLIKIIMLKRVT